MEMSSPQRDLWTQSKVPHPYGIIRFNVNVLIPTGLMDHSKCPHPKGIVGLNLNVLIHNISIPRSGWGGWIHLKGIVGLNLNVLIYYVSIPHSGWGGWTQSICPHP
jgi:hypothetical protein